MRFKLLLLTILATGFNAFSQTSFEPGYITFTNGTTTNCLIKNEDWKGGPRNFEYKIDENSEVKIGSVLNVKEFGSSENFKYIAATLPVEQSSDKVGNLTEDRNPIFKEESLFLKVLVEGNASLYYTLKETNNRFFYKMNDGKIEQLIYKRYITSNKEIAKNNRYKQQLATDFVCSKSQNPNFDKLEYKQSSLISSFKNYNACIGSEAVTYKNKDYEYGFNLSLRPGVTFGAASVLKAGDEKINFDSKTGFRIGLEAEYILPFNNGKWAIFIEPTYRNYNAEKEVVYVDFFTIKKTTLITVEYNSVELPIGARYYMFLNKKSALYVNAAVLIDASVLDSKIESSNEDSYDLDIKADAALAIGFGFKFKNKYSLEANYHSPRNISNYLNVSSSYQSFSLIAGYNFL
jgi:hypothetical protein